MSNHNDESLTIRGWHSLDVDERRGHIIADRKPDVFVDDGFEDYPPLHLPVEWDGVRP